MSDTAVPLIATRALSAGYGSRPVVSDLDLEVRPGEVVALLGPNGAGKTTTLRALSGDLTPMSGEVRWLGTPGHAPLHRRAREGLAYVGERAVFTRLDTTDNLRVGRVPPDRAVALFPELEKRLRTGAGMLSGGEQQMLSLARALCRTPGSSWPTNSPWVSPRWSSTASCARSARRPTRGWAHCWSNSTCARCSTSPTASTYCAEAGSS